MAERSHTSGQNGTRDMVIYGCRPPTRSSSDLGRYGASGVFSDKPYWQEQSKIEGRSSSTRCMSFLGDPELQRKKRVATYRAYSAHGKMRDSFRRSFRWVKNKCSDLVHGF